jgi:hypothetical protein
MVFIAFGNKMAKKKKGVGEIKREKTIPDCGYSFSIEATLCMVNICYHVRHELQQKTVAKAKEKINIPVEVVQKSGS